MDNRPGMLMPAMIGGFVFGALAGVPVVNCLCCALAAGAGFLAAFLYSRKCADSGAEFRGGQGALVGLTAAPFYAVAAAVVGSFFSMLMPTSPEDLDEMIEQLEQADLPPEAIDWITRFAEGSGGAAGFFIGLVFSLVLAAIFATLGGLIGGSVFKVAPSGPSGPAQPSATPPPPPPPATGV